MCDALATNTADAFDTLRANCIAHARRRFVDVVDHFPDEVRHVLEILREVYRTDALARERGLSPEERLRLHQTDSGPRMAELATWLHQQLDEHLVEPNSGLGTAIAYMLKHWSADPAAEEAEEGRRLISLNPQLLTIARAPRPCCAGTGRRPAPLSTHTHRVLKDELAARVLPCGRFAANAAWFRLNVITYNLLTLLRRRALPARYAEARPKRLRFEVFTLPGRLTLHQRQLDVSVSADPDRTRELVEARQRLLALYAASA